MTKEKGKKSEMSVEQNDDGTVTIHHKSKVLIQNPEDFYAEINSKSEKDFAEEIGGLTLELWRTIIKYSLKRNIIKGKKQVNMLKAFCDEADVTFAVMRTLKAQLLKGAKKIDDHMMTTVGKSLGLTGSLDKFIKIATSEEMHYFGKKEKKKRDSYVA